MSSVSIVSGRLGQEIKVGSIVCVVTPEYALDGTEGVVVDVSSDLSPEDGPIAVFFDKEVEDDLFWTSRDLDWRGGLPTADNYRDCPRVRCFNQGELGIITKFSLSTMANRLFGKGTWDHTRELSFPLQPGVGVCHFKRCRNLPTHEAIVNNLRTIRNVYCCAACYEEAHGKLAEVLELKFSPPKASAGQ
jgi:hypothetical protein